MILLCTSFFGDNEIKIPKHKIKKHIIAITFNEDPNINRTCRFSAKKRENSFFFLFIFVEISPHHFLKKKDCHPMFFVLLGAITPNFHEEGLFQKG